MKSSEIIERAIEILWDSKTPLYIQHYSCCAVDVVKGASPPDKERALDCLVEMGCNPLSGREFQEFQDGESRQYARALWLTFAAHVLREEGD